MDLLRSQAPGVSLAQPLRVLLTIQTLEGPAGGSLYVRDLAMELVRQGHQPSVYCPRLGSVSQEILNSGIPVVAHVDRVLQPDVIHGNSPIETVAAMLRFPQTPAIFVGHGWLSPDCRAPLLPNIVRYLAVGQHSRDALVSFCGVPEDLITIHYNPVDLKRFARRSPLPVMPQRALVFNNDISSSNCLGAIEEGCHRAGLTVDVIGLTAGTARLDPERFLHSYDVVFATGRAALEALATGCSVILAGPSGLGELVMTQNYALGGQRDLGAFALRLPVDPATVEAQLKRYDTVDAAMLTDHVRATAGLFDSTIELVGIYREAIKLFASRTPSDPVEDRLQLAQFLDSMAPTANSFFYANQTASLRARLNISDNQLRRLALTLGTPPLARSELTGLRMELNSVPSQSTVGSEIEAVILIRNDTGRIIGSLGASPVRASYHWLTEDGGMLEFEGRRSELFPPLPSGQQHPYCMKITTPEVPGQYRLRLTLVQEGVQWFDVSGIFCDAPVVVD